MTTRAKRSFEPVIAWLLVIGSVIGVVCSFIISLDKLKIIENPHFQPNCNLNPIISCGNVMRSSQGSVFGFPNPWIGLVCFGILLAVGMGMFAGARFKRWFWLGLEAGTIFGMVFAYWLLFESVYRIHALCPYCLTVDVVVTTQFWYVSLHMIRSGIIGWPKGRWWQRSLSFVSKHHLDILLLWFLIVIIAILHHFWYYFGSHLF